MRTEKEIGEIIRSLRGDMSLRDFAKKCDISHTTIDNIEKGFDFRTGKPVQIKITTLQKIASACAVPVSQIIGEHESTHRKGVRIPVYGYVAAGIPIEAIDNFDSSDPDDWEEIDEDMARGGEYFALRIKGDSMEPKISSGDVVIVRRQPDVETGDVAIVCVNGDEATCKKIKKTPEGIMLISLNQAYEPMFYSNKQIEELPLTILGRVVELRAKF